MIVDWSPRSVQYSVISIVVVRYVAYCTDEWPEWAFPPKQKTDGHPWMDVDVSQWLLKQSILVQSTFRTYSYVTACTPCWDEVGAPNFPRGADKRGNMSLEG